MNFGQYVKTAFLNRWNLLAFLAGSAFALLTGRPDVFLPVVMAGEVGYLGLLAAHPKFQAYVEAQAAKQVREQGAASNQQSLRAIMQALPPRSIDRFQALRSRCMELRQIALALKEPTHTGVSILDETQCLRPACRRRTRPRRSCCDRRRWSSPGRTWREPPSRQGRQEGG